MGILEEGFDWSSHSCAPLITETSDHEYQYGKPYCNLNGLRERKALRLVFDDRGDQKTTAGSSSEKTSSENDVEVEMEKGNLNLGRSRRNIHLDVLLQKGAKQAK